MVQCTDNEVLFHWDQGVSLLVQRSGMGLGLVMVQCTDNKVCKDKFCTDSVSDKGVSLSVLYQYRDPSVLWIVSVSLNWSVSLLHFPHKGYVNGLLKLNWFSWSLMLFKEKLPLTTPLKFDFVSDWRCH